MIKNIFTIFINSLLITLFIFIFIYSNDVKEIILFGINIWINNLIPSILPFLLITKLLINYNIIEYLNIIFGKFITKFFKVSNNSTFIIIMSLFTGFPTGSIYIKEFLNKNLISLEEANYLITFTSFSNPLFVISGIGESLLGNKSIGILIYTIHLISGLLISFVYRKNSFNNNAYHNTSIQNNNSFISSLNIAIKESFNILINMLGIILFFLLIISLIRNIIPNLFIKNILTGLLEITSGINFLSKSNIPLNLKASIIGFFISFNGISIHFQIKSIISNTQIKYSKYLSARILQSILCFILIYLICNVYFIYNNNWS